MTRLSFGRGGMGRPPCSDNTPVLIYWNGTDGEPRRQNKRQYILKTSSSGTCNFSQRPRKRPEHGGYREKDVLTFFLQALKKGSHILCTLTECLASPNFPITCTCVLYAWPAAIISHPTLWCLPVLCVQIGSGKWWGCGDLILWAWEQRWDRRLLEFSANGKCNHQ